MFYIPQKRQRCEDAFGLVFGFFGVQVDQYSSLIHHSKE
jgi:hypothetical protein